MFVYRTMVAIVLGSLGVGVAGLVLTPGSWFDPLRTATEALATARSSVEQRLKDARAFFAGALEQEGDRAQAMLNEAGAALGNGTGYPAGASGRAGRPGEPAGLAGPAQVIDGDTIEVGGTRVRLRRIDAPETDQVCYSPGGPWACGRGATATLADWTRGREVRCIDQGRDRYGRILGDCSVSGQTLGEAMVIHGWAMAWPGAGLEHREVEARRAGRGIWTSRFVPPWDWRRGERMRPGR